MFNRVFIQRTDPQYGGAEAFKTAYSMHVRDIPDRGTETGFATQKLLESLGIVVVTDNEYATMHIEIPHEALKSKLPVLQRSIGLIARYSSEKSPYLAYRTYAKEYWGKRLGNLVKKLPTYTQDDNSKFIEEELYKSAEYCGDQNERTVVVRNSMPWWPISSQEEKYVDDMSRSKGLSVWDYDITER